MGLTTTSTAESPGKAATRPMFFRGPRAVELWTGTIAFDDAYPTGGEAWNAESETGFSDIVQVWVMPTAGFVFQYVDSDTAANRKIKAYWVDTTTDGASLAEVVDTTDINANLTAVPVLVLGYR